MPDRYRAAIEGMSDSFLILDEVRDPGGAVVDFRFEDCNQLAISRLGRPRDEVIGKLYTEVYPAAIESGILALLLRAATDRQAFAGEVTLDVPQFGFRTVRLRITPLDSGLAIASTDITDQRALERQRDLHTAVVNNMSEGVCLVRTSDLAIIYTNPKFDRIMGYRAGELIGQHVSIVNDGPRVEAARHAEQIVGSIREHGEATYEIDNVRKDGTRVRCRGTGSLLHDPDHGEVIVAVQADITEARRMDEERRGFFELSLDMLCIAGFDGMFRRLNPAWQVVLGWSVEELTSKPFLDFVHPDDRAKTIEETAALGRGSSTISFENRYLHKNGSYRVLAWRSVPSRAHDLIFASARDITQHREDQRALQASNAEKEVLLKEIHHRVKNNLQVISSLLKLQAEQTTAPEARAAMRDSQDRVASIALLHEKLYQSKHLGSVDMAEYATSLATTLLRTQRIGQAPRLVVEAHVDLPIDLAVPCGLILNEVMTNALKHAFPTAHSSPTITIELREEHGEIELVIADNGRGLPDQVEIASARTLGMHLIRTLARQLRGKLEITSHAGTRVSIRFPRDADQED